MLTSHSATHPAVTHTHPVSQQAVSRQGGVSPLLSLLQLPRSSVPYTVSHTQIANSQQTWLTESSLYSKHFAAPSVSSRVF